MSADFRAPIGYQLLNVPFPEMIKSMGLAIAGAQYELDQVSLRLAQVMSGKYEEILVDPITGNETVVERTALVTFDGKELSLLELGFTPTFYQFVDTLIEVKISMSMSYSEEFKRKSSSTSIKAAYGHFFFGGGASLRISSVSASYANKFQYSAEGSSLLRTKLVPIPTPPVLEERIQVIVERERKAREEAEGGGGGGG